MARMSASFQNATMAAVADTTTFTSGQAAGFLRSGGATQQLKINEVYIGGESGASNPTTMVLARDSTISVGTLSGGGLNTSLDFLSTAPGTLPSFGNIAGTTYPQRGGIASLYLLDLSLNGYGGISRWQARYGEEITLYGNTANGGEVSLSSKAGTGQFSGHILFETV